MEVDSKMFSGYLPKSQIAKTITGSHGCAFMLNSRDAVCTKQPSQPFIKVVVISVDVIKHGKNIGTIGIPASCEKAAVAHIKNLSDANSYYGIQYKAHSNEDIEALKSADRESIII